jgi:signal transducing adaptor molecule
MPIPFDAIDFFFGKNTHEKVRKRALGLIAEWAAEFENDESLGIMEDCYNNLKAKSGEGIEFSVPYFFLIPI